jgi:N-acetylmuramoyl-L-alanine amidase
MSLTGFEGGARSNCVIDLGMKKGYLRAFGIMLMGLAALGLSLVLNSPLGRAVGIDGRRIAALPIEQLLKQAPAPTFDPQGLLSQDCGFRPPANPQPPSRAALQPVRLQLGLERFRQPPTLRDPNLPRESVALAHPTNFGLRYQQDLGGRSATNAPIIVLHETVSSASSTLNLFQTAHDDDDDQVSYHTLIDLDGSVIYLVPPDKRAFGAAQSRFNQERVQTNPRYPASVNNFAYHVSLVTPVDGRNDETTHSGYTEAQYESLAWLVAKTGVPIQRITTHRLVDQSGQRIDPRSFDGPGFLKRLARYPSTHEISITCRLVTAQTATGQLARRAWSGGNGQ